MSANKITGRSAFLALLKDEDYASFWKSRYNRVTDYGRAF